MVGFEGGGGGPVRAPTAPHCLVPVVRVAPCPAGCNSRQGKNPALVMAVTDRSAADCRVFLYFKFSQPAGAGRNAQDEWNCLRCLPDWFSRPEGLFIRRCAQDEPGRPPSIVVADCDSNSLQEYYVQKGETVATDVSAHAPVTTLVGERMGCGTLRPRGVTSLRDVLLVHLDRVRVSRCSLFHVEASPYTHTLACTAVGHDAPFFRFAYPHAMYCYFCLVPLFPVSRWASCRSVRLSVLGRSTRTCPAG